MQPQSFFVLMVLLAQALTAAPAWAASDRAQAAERCEQAVGDTLRGLRGHDARDLRFVASRRVLTPQSEDETAVRGEGSYRVPGGASVSFTYGCAYDAAKDVTSGVVLRENAGRGGAIEKPFEPDLTHVSPQACESAAAAALSKEHPRVARINFGSDSRRLQPAESGRIAMTGGGSVERAPGMNLIPFHYRCEVDPRSGRVLSIDTQE